MKISKLVKLLQDKQLDHGNIEVELWAGEELGWCTPKVEYSHHNVGLFRTERTVQLIPDTEG